MQMNLSSRVQDDPQLESLRQRFLPRRTISLATVFEAMVVIFLASRIL
jgi:hypothetical protein